MRIWEGPKRSVIVRLTEAEAWKITRELREDEGADSFLDTVGRIHEHLAVRHLQPSYAVSDVLDDPESDNQVHRYPDSTCIRCGCTELRACPGGCGWVKLDSKTNAGICSSCGVPARAKKKRR